VVCLNAFMLGTALLTQGQAKLPPITEVTLQRTPCFGTCPVYKVTLRPNGTLSYHGELFVSRKGNFTAKYWSHDFVRLASAIDAVHFDSFSTNYSMPVTDQSSTIVTVVRGKTSKSVEVYGSTGPDTLWLIAAAIDGMVANARDWAPVKAKPHAK